MQLTNCFYGNQNVPPKSSPNYFTPQKISKHSALTMLPFGRKHTSDVCVKREPQTSSTYQFTEAIILEGQEIARFLSSINLSNTPSPDSTGGRTTTLPECSPSPQVCNSHKRRKPEATTHFCAAPPNTPRLHELNKVNSSFDLDIEWITALYNDDNDHNKKQRIS